MTHWVRKGNKLYCFDWRKSKIWSLTVTTFLIEEGGRLVGEWWSVPPDIAELRINRTYSTHNTHEFENEQDAIDCAKDYEICLTLLQL